MAEVSVGINGRQYGMVCDDGQEKRVNDLGRYVDSKLKQISASGAANNETHLLVLTSLLLADELLDLKDRVSNQNNPQGASNASPEDEKLIVDAIDHLAGRIQIIAERVGGL